MYVERECTDWISVMKHSFLCHFRDACIHLCDTMVHVCIHICVKIHLLCHACVGQDSCIHVTMNHAHVSGDPDMRIDSYSDIYSSMDIHCCFCRISISFSLLFRTHTHVCLYIILSPYPYIFTKRENLHIQSCEYIHTHVDLERDGICDM